LQALVGVLVGFVVMMVMVVCCLTATVLLLVIMSWVVDCASRIFSAGGHSRVPDG